MTSRGSVPARDPETLTGAAAMSCSPDVATSQDTADHARFLAQKRFRSLDGLRAICIVTIIWTHTAPPWVNERLAHIGSQGVTLFFAISGFLITTLLLRERARNAAIDIKSFYVRRVLRIFPLYYGVLMLYIVVVTLMERHTAAGRAFFAHLVYFATCTSNLFVPLDGRVIFYFAWSVAAEEQFYLVWPSLLHLSRTESGASIVLCLVGAVCVTGQWLGIPHFGAFPVATVAGALLAVMLHTRNGFSALQLILGWTWSPVIFAIALTLVLTVATAPGFVVDIILAGLVGACVIREKHSLAPFLSLGPIVYVGSISYGMYLLHMLCKNLAIRLLGEPQLVANGFVLFAVTLLMAIVAAGVSFRYYESMFLKLKRVYER
jgi:peptidoglycan/LPS O-acetylase OafA/YrhL